MSAAKQNQPPTTGNGQQLFAGSLWLGPVLSGLLTFTAVCQIHFWPNWICFLPFFISVLRAAPVTAFKKGMVFGAALGLPTFFWMVAGGERFTGGALLYGILALIVCTALLSLYHGGISYFFTRFKRKENGRWALVINCCFTAAVFCTAEGLLRLLARPFPWFGVYAGSGLSDNLYSLQPVALFGPAVLSFIVVAVNYLAAHFVFTIQYRKLYVPVGVFAIYLLAGFLLFSGLNIPPSGRPFKVVTLAVNIPPETVWDSASGNGLAERLFALNRSAVSLKPDIILWPETAVPWMYNKNDELLNEVLRLTAPAKTTHILGVGTAYSQKEVFNSAYAILPDGSVADRYDKRYPLWLLEQPVNGMMLPFFTGSGVTVRPGEAQTSPLATPYGKAGILICNESTIPAAAVAQVQGGAQFLFNMSNDGWFSDSYLARIHFFNARMRAVEVRKDVVVNSNTGYSGFINARGEVQQMEKSDAPFVLPSTVHPNAFITLVTTLPHLFIYSCIAFVMLVAILPFKGLPHRL